MFEEYGYNKEIIERYISLIGKQETKKLLEANEKKLPTWIRVNTLKISKEELIKRLSKKGYEFSEDKRCKDVLKVLKQPFKVGTTNEYLMGYYYIQDITSALCVQELNPLKSEIILDGAAAPGGKTTHISQLMENQGIVLAVDKNLKKMKALRFNLERLGIKNTIAVRMDLKEIKDLGIKFNKILLDVPCSGEGVIMKDLERKKTLTMGEIKKYSELQKKFIDSAFEVLEKNGILVYSTCSLAPEENEENIDYAVKKYNFKTEKVKHGSPAFSEAFGKKYSKQVLNCRRFWPQDGTQGFFTAKLRRW